MHHQRNLYPPSSYNDYGGGGGGGGGYGSNYQQPHHHQHQQPYDDYHHHHQHPHQQHNHPPYYSHQQQQQQPYQHHNQDSSIHHHHQHQYHGDHSYQNGYPAGGGGGGINRSNYNDSYGQSQTPYTDRSYQPPPPQQQQQQPQPPPPPQPPKSSYPPSLNLKPTSSSTSKNPYGQTGPYGIDASNPYADYYRKLYYPYDPITGEYMKDATPPGGDSGTTNLLPNVMPDSMANQMLHSAHHHHSSTSGRYGGGGSAMGGGGGGGHAAGGYGAYGNDPSSMLMMSNYYGMMGDHENDSLLLCCDFLIPRPNIKCLLITLFILLVLIILIAVIRFLVSLNGDQNEELATLLEQTCMLLLIGALGDLLWIIGIYFTSRRTRKQISTILSCATNINNNHNNHYNSYDNTFHNYDYFLNNNLPQQQQHQFTNNLAIQSAANNQHRSFSTTNQRFTTTGLNYV